MRLRSLPFSVFHGLLEVDFLALMVERPLWQASELLIRFEDIIKF